MSGSRKINLKVICKSSLKTKLFLITVRYQNMIRLLSLSMLVAFFVFVQTARAFVDIKSGTFSTSQSDQSAKIEGFALSRVYNSTVNFTGLFGFGWCSDFETSLTVIAKGQILVVSCGAGEAKVYSSASFKERNVSDAIAQLEKAMRAKGQTMSEFEREKISRSYFLRAQMIEKYQVKFDVQDSVYKLNGMGSDDQIIYKDQIFVRESNVGFTQKFDIKGRLIELAKDQQHKLKLAYDKKGLHSVVSQAGEVISFTLNEQGQVKVMSGSTVTTYFTYVDGNLLSQVKEGKTLEHYAYEDSYLTAFETPDEKLKINYDRNGFVSSVQSGECTDNYIYDIKKQKLKFTVARQISCRGRLAQKVKYDFEYQVKPDGALYQKRMIATANKGGKSSAEYLPDGRPIFISRRGRESHFEYDKNQRLTVQKSSLGRFEYTYNSKGRLESIKLLMKKKSGPHNYVKYNYDASGRVKAVSLKNETVEYGYDRQGYLNFIKSSKGHQYNLQNDSVTGRVTQISVKGYGQFIMTYSDNGEPQSNKWTGKATVAMDVWDTYESFLSVLRQPENIGVL